MSLICHISNMFHGFQPKKLIGLHIKLLLTINNKCLVKINDLVSLIIERMAVFNNQIILIPKQYIKIKIYILIT